MSQSGCRLFSVRNWADYQHYKDRDPTWVKLYRDMLTSESWVLGTDLSRLVQVASLLLAARYSNQIPMQWKLIRKVASLDCNEKDFDAAVSHLVSSNFLEAQEVTAASNSLAHGASTALATCNTEERREEGEKSREEGSTRASARSATRLPEDFALTPERRLVAEAETLPADRTFAKFCDHWKAASGARARKLDWDATWRNWCREDADRNGARNGARGHSAKPSAVETVNRATAEWAERRGVDPASI